MQLDPQNKKVMLSAEKRWWMIPIRISPYPCIFFFVILLYLDSIGYLNLFNRNIELELGHRSIFFRKADSDSESSELTLQKITDSDEYVTHKTRAQKQLSLFNDVEEWCAINSNYSRNSVALPSSEELAIVRQREDVWDELTTVALIITSNFPWKPIIGLLQRLYQPYFKVTVFCGTLYPGLYLSGGGFPDIISPFVYINLTEHEMNEGYFAYHCLVRAKELELNVKGYFVMSDDVVFNFWHTLPLDKVFHPTGITYRGHLGQWWPSYYGAPAIRRAFALITDKYRNDEKVQRMFKKYQKGLNANGFNQNAYNQLLEIDGWCISDLYYVPASELGYYADLMNIFYEAGVFHEIAISKFLYSIPHNKLEQASYLYLWEERHNWSTLYHEDLVFLHPVKLGLIKNIHRRERFCNTVVRTFKKRLFGGTSPLTALENQ